MRVSSAASSNCFRSTHYTMNSSGNKFFNSQNISSNTGFNAPSTNFHSSNNNNYEQLINLHPTREIKSSYSTLRPRYDYTNLVIEKNSMNMKHKEIAEKRNQEEMKEFINEWGISRARYVEEVEKKNEIKRMLKFYEKNLAGLQKIQSNNDYTIINTFSNLNGSYNNNTGKFQNDEAILTPKTHINSQNQENESLTADNRIQSPEIRSNTAFNYGSKGNSPERSTVNSPLTKIKENEENEDLGLKKILTNKNSNENRKRRENLKNRINKNDNDDNYFNLEANPYKEISNNVEYYERHKTSNVKNMDQNNLKLKENKEQKIIDIKFKEQPSYNKALDIIQQMKSNLEKIPTDKVILMKAHDKVFETRHNFANLLHVKEIDNYKDGYKYHITPLSLYDNLNIKALENHNKTILNKSTNNISSHKKLEENLIEENLAKNHKRPSTGFEFLRSRYNNNPDSDNFLNQRKILTKFNSDFTFQNPEKARNSSFNYERVKSAFTPPIDDTNKYSKYFLPTPGFGLLPKPIDPNAKKKNRGKSTKKKKK